MKAATIYYCITIKFYCISIHAAREGGDIFGLYGSPTWEISIHAAREGGDFNGDTINIRLIISIHAAREGGDKSFSGYVTAGQYFNPRRP